MTKWLTRKMPTQRTEKKTSPLIHLLNWIPEFYQLYLRLVQMCFFSTQFNSVETLQLNLFLITSLLQGVNRAFPYVSTDEADDIIESETPVLFKLVTPLASSYKFRFKSCNQEVNKEYRILNVCRCIRRISMWEFNP